MDAWPFKVAVMFKGHSFTFADMDAAANRIANWAAASLRLTAGDTAALLVNNRPEFIALWVGLAKLGVKCAFINTALTGKRLSHCVRIVSPRALIYEETLRPAVAGVAEGIASSLPGMAFALLPLATQGSGKHTDKLPSGLQEVDVGVCAGKASDSRPSRLLRAGVGPLDTFGYIYSSGTTGLNKACPVPHSKLLLAGLVYHVLFGIRGDDILYEVLPLFHSAAGIIAQSLLMTQGTTLALREKFSLSAFWDDVATTGATVVQYIGELCRYLAAGPPHPLERQHRLRLAFGNGLRPDVWPKFVARFGIAEIGEFYAATEGNVNLWNHCHTPPAAMALNDEGKPPLASWPGMGAVGRLGALAHMTKKFPIVRFDMDTEEVVRAPSGRCIECRPGEAGEMLGVISARDPTSSFKGYAGGEKSGANAKKLLRDVFAVGDVYFRSGDLLRRDAGGYIHFSDRIGDTFRWHGENVATTEVAEVVSQVPGVADVNVYGVAVPGHDGRAGCAAIVPSGDVSLAGTVISTSDHATGQPLELNDVATRAIGGLPKYALPIFVRLLPAQPVTSTFKHQKVALRRDGADPTVVPDPVFILDAKLTTYSRLTPHAWGEIIAGQAKL